MLATRNASWPLAVLERLGLRCLLPPCAERMLRMWTSVALKKATMKGCLLWGPLRPTSPATHGFRLWPEGGDREMFASRNHVKHKWHGAIIYATNFQKWNNLFSFIQLNSKENIEIVCGNTAQSHKRKSQSALWKFYGSPEKHSSPACHKADYLCFIKPSLRS